MNDAADRATDHPPEDQLSAYLLGELPRGEAGSLEEHLDRCARCRATLGALEDAFVAAVERLPRQAPPRDAWSRLEARVAREPVAPSTPSRGRTGAWVAGLAASLVAAAALGAWGAWQRDRAVEARAQLEALEARVERLEAQVGTVQARADGLDSDQGRLSRWLARDDVTMARLPAVDGGVAPGSVLFLPDGRALIVMRDVPAAARAFQVWGVRDGAYEALARTEERTVEVQAGPYPRLAVSIEPEEGSDAPTELLGEVPAG